MGLLNRLFSTQPDPRARLQPLWDATVRVARDRYWYAECGVADSVAGRFDMVTAVLALVVLRMERNGDLARDTALLTELFVGDMDAQVRELGIGDIVVGKHIGKLVGALGGRIDAYRAGILHGPERMTQAVSANITWAEGGAAERVAGKLLDLAERLRRTDDEALLAGEIAA